MKIIKIAFIAVLAISFCSFAYNNSHEEGREQLFKDFLSQFKSIELPTKTSFKAPSDKEKANRTVLDEKFDAFIPGITNGRMSRMGPSTYEAELLLSSTNNFATLIYSRSRGFDGRNKSYYLATFDQHGTEIGNHQLGYVHESSYIDLDLAADMKMLVTSMQTDDYDAAEKNFFPKTIKKMFVTAKGEIMVEEDRPFQKEDIAPTKQQAQKLG
jgi:hypothetical protein